MVRYDKANRSAKYTEQEGKPFLQGRRVFAVKNSGLRNGVRVKKDRRNTYTKDTLLPDQLDQLILRAALSISLGIRLEIAQVSNVSLVICWCTMSLSMWVEMWASAGAAVGVVAELVDVDAALGGRVAAGDVPGYGGRGRLGGLFEGDGAGNFGVPADDGD